ncbi:MAG: GTP 3',8-cyclase MoaA [Desulfobacteraceae bacterium]|nr:MAG: GTP 3',8-cyclase MoaA [Desulfobacteraceae bacterium]
MNDFSEKGDSTPGTLIDPSNRILDYLRVSITDRCNLNCTYCLPLSGQTKQDHHHILRYEEILRLIRIFRDLGISKIRITGGEPLIRKGVLPFIAKLHQIKGIKDLAMTTNGLLLLNHLDEIRSAGIRRLNISLDSLNPETYRRITGHDVFQTVWEGILAAEKMGFHPIKINVVALRGINDHELTEMAKLSLAHPFHIRFIEYMPIGDSALHSENPLFAQEIQEQIESLGKLYPVDREKTDGPARRFRFQQAKGEIGFISPISRHFCNTCNRLRLTADGSLRTCLLSDLQTDLKTPLRSGFSDRQITGLIREAIRLKPTSHNLNTGHPAVISGRMSSIGG